MKVVTREKTWFLSNQGQEEFNKLETLEEKTFFVFNYLVAIRDNDAKSDDKNVLFKIAFLLADAILNSNLEYSKWPYFLDSKKNPFIGYVENVSAIKYEIEIYIAFLSIIHEIANPFLKSEWIYNAETMSASNYAEKLKELEHEFIVSYPIIPNPKCFEIEENKKFVQLEIYWLFGNSKNRR